MSESARERGEDGEVWFDVNGKVLRIRRSDHGRMTSMPFLQLPREDWLHGGLENIGRFAQKCDVQHAFQPVMIAKSIGS